MEIYISILIVGTLLGWGVLIKEDGKEITEGKFSKKHLWKFLAAIPLGWLIIGIKIAECGD